MELMLHSLLWLLVLPVLVIIAFVNLAAIYGMYYAWRTL
jgi:hypothetical protein